MTSNKTPTPSSPFRLVACAVLGVGLIAYGVFHGFDSYPAPDVFARFSAALPAVEAVASFALGLAAILVGLVLVVPALYRLRNRGRQRPAFGGSPGLYGGRAVQAARPTPARRDEDYDYDPEGYGGEDYPAHPGQGHGSGYGGRPRDNGEYDERRWAGSYR